MATRRQTNLSAARLRGAIAASAITIVSGIALPIGAQAEVVTPQPVTPQVVTPQVLTPPPAASPAPEPAAAPVPSEPPAGNPGPASIASPDGSPPSPRSPDIQIPNRGKLPVGLVDCTIHCHERRQAEALVYAIALIRRNQFFAGLDPVNLIVGNVVSQYSMEHPVPGPQAIGTAAQAVEDMVRDMLRGAAAGASKLLEELFPAQN